MFMKLSDYVFDFIAQTGIGHVFFLPGGGCMHLVDSLGKHPSLRHVCCLHEQAAVIAAEAYSQYNNCCGAALVTTGPGATNAITGVAGAWIDSTPLIMISGQVKRSDMMKGRGVRQMGIQEVDIVSLVKPITKYAVTVMNPAMIRYHLQKAFYLASHGRKGPVWIDIPLDVQGSLIDETNLPEFSPQEVSDGLGIDQDIKEKARRSAQMLTQAKRPVILAGNGIRLCHATDTFTTLIETLQVPVLLTWKASDFLWEEHPLYCGKPGIIGQRGANFTQQNADFLMCLGARLDLCQIGFNYANFSRCARKVIVDIDKNEISKIDTFIDVPVHADVGVFMNHLLKVLQEMPCGDDVSWLRQCKDWQKRYPVMQEEYRRSQGLVNPYTFFDVLSDLLVQDDLIVPESSGASAEMTQQAIRLKRGQRILNTPGLGSMGFGLAASMGACLASSQRRTVCVIGDGGLQHNIQELATLARLNLPLKVFVLNNNGYASIRNMQNNHFKGRHVACDLESGLALPDTCRVAQAYHLKTAKIGDQKDLARDMQKVLELPGTVICEVMLDPEIPTAPRMSSKALPDGRMVSKPMEDLWPFMDRDEWKSNMLIPEQED